MKDSARGRRGRVTLRAGAFILALSLAPAGLRAQSGGAEPQQVAGAELRDYYSANGLLNRGLHDLAEADYRKFLGQHPDHDKAAVARYGLGVCLYRLGKFDDATAELGRVASEDAFPFAAEALTILGQCHLATARNDAAAEAFLGVLARYDSHALVQDAAVGLAEALYALGKYDDAVEHCRRYSDRVKSDPLAERLAFVWSLATVALGEDAASAPRLSGFLKKYPHSAFAARATLLLAQCDHRAGRGDDAIARYRKAIESGDAEDSAAALLGLGTLLLSRGDAEKAGEIFDRLLKEHPDHALAVEARLHRGRAWFEMSRFEAAESAFAEVIKGGGDFVDDAAYWHAKCALRRGDFRTASDRLSAAAERFPQSDLIAEMLFDRAVALTQLSDNPAAVSALEEFLSRFPAYDLASAALHMLALTEHRRGAYRESNAHCRSYIEKYPSGELASSVAFLEAENDFLFGDYESAVERYRALAHGAGDDPQTRKARYRLGLALHRLGRFEEAAEALEPIAVSAPTDATFHPALLALGDCAFQRGEWKKAEQYMEAYLSAEGAPSADDALLKLGLAQARQGRYKDALPCFDRLLRDVPDSSHRLQTMFERGQALVALDDPDGAAEAFERVVSEGADSQFVPYALNHLGAIALRRQQFDKAAEILGRVTADAPTSADALFQRGQALFAAQDFESAERVFTEFASGNPADAERLAEARARAAICVARQDRCQEAVGAIDQLQRDHWSSLAAPLRDSVLYEKAWCLRQLGDADAAGDIYRLLVNDATQAGIRAHAAVELAAIEFAGRRYEAAAKLLRAALDGAEGASASLTADLEEQTLYRLAVCDFELSEYDAAADLLEKLIEKYPKSGLLPSALSFCGDALLRLDQAERAAKHLTRVVEEFPSDPACAPSLLRLGEAYAALHRWAQSERAFDDYLSRYPGAEHWFQAQFGVGWARENQQRYAEAIRAYEKVVAGHQGPTAGRAQFQIGECLYALKRHEEAIRELLKVDILYAYPEWSAAALYEAGRCFEELGKGVEARQQYEQVAQKHGETRWAEMAAKRLATVADASIPGR